MSFKLRVEAKCRCFAAGKVYSVIGDKLSTIVRQIVTQRIRAVVWSVVLFDKIMIKI